MQTLCSVPQNAVVVVGMAGATFRFPGRRATSRHAAPRVRVREAQCRCANSVMANHSHKASAL